MSNSPHTAAPSLAEFILDLLAGDAKSFLASGVIFVTLQEFFDLRSRYGFHKPPAPRSGQKDDSYLSMCPSADNITLKWKPSGSFCWLEAFNIDGFIFFRVTGDKWATLPSCPSLCTMVAADWSLPLTYLPFLSTKIKWISANKKGSESENLLVYNNSRSTIRIRGSTELLSTVHSVSGSVGVSKMPMWLGVCLFAVVTCSSCIGRGVGGGWWLLRLVYSSAYTLCVRVDVCSVINHQHNRGRCFSVHQLNKQPWHSSTISYFSFLNLLP